MRALNPIYEQVFIDQASGLQSTSSHRTATLTVPAGEVWQVYCVSIRLVTSDTGGNRHPAVIFLDSSNRTMHRREADGVGPFQDRSITFAPVSDSGNNQRSMPVMLLFPGQKVQCNIGAGWDVRDTGFYWISYQKFFYND